MYIYKKPRYYYSSDSSDSSDGGGCCKGTSDCPEVPDNKLNSVPYQYKIGNDVYPFEGAADTPANNVGHPLELDIPSQGSDQPAGTTYVPNTGWVFELALTVDKDFVDNTDYELSRTMTLTSTTSMKTSLGTPVVPVNIVTNLTPFDDYTWGLKIILPSTIEAQLVKFDFIANVDLTHDSGCQTHQLSFGGKINQTANSCTINAGGEGLVVREIQYLSNIQDFTQTRSGIKPGDEYNLTMDPNIGDIIDDLGITFDPALGIYLLNGVEISVDDIFTQADVFINPNTQRDLGGFLLPSNSSPSILYQEVSKLTDPLRNGPVFKSTERQYANWTSYYIDKEQGDITIDNVQFAMDFTGPAALPNVPISQYYETQTQFVVVQPPLPSTTNALTSFHGVFTVTFHETANEECIRTQVLDHWVDLEPDQPDIQLTIFDTYSDMNTLTWNVSYITDINATNKNKIETKLNSIKPEITTSEWKIPQTGAYANQRIPVVLCHFNIAQRILGVDPAAQDWIFMSARNTGEYKANTTYVLQPTKDPPGTATKYFELTDWIKHGYARDSASTVLPKIPPMVYAIGESFMDKNPRQYPRFLPGDEPNGLYGIEYRDYDYDNPTTLCKIYKDETLYAPTFPGLGSGTWNPPGEFTKANPGGNALTCPKWRKVVPISTNKVTNPLGGQNFWTNCYVHAIPVRPDFGGDLFFQLESQYLKKKVTLQCKLKIQAVLTSRAGVKIAGSDTDGTSYHTVSSNTLTVPWSQTFDWTAENTEDHVVTGPLLSDEFPQGLVDGPDVWTYTITSTPTSYTVTSPNLSSFRTFKGVARVRHFNGESGYYHFFEVTREPVPDAPRQFFGPSSNKYFMGSPNRDNLTLNADGFGSYVSFKNDNQSLFYVQQGRNPAVKPIVWIPFHCNLGATVTPRLEFAPSHNTQTSFNTPATVVANFIHHDGTSSPARYDVGSNSIVPYQVAGFYAKCTTGIQMIGLRFENIPQWDTSNLNDPQFVIFHAWASNFFKSTNPTLLTAQSQFLSNTSGIVVANLFQETTTGNVPAGTLKLLSGNQGFNYFRFNKADFIPGSLSVVMQGGANNQTPANQLNMIQGPDLGTPNWAVASLRTETPIAETATTVTYSFAKPNGGMGYIRGFTYWPATLQ